MNLFFSFFSIKRDKREEERERIEKKVKKGVCKRISESLDPDSITTATLLRYWAEFSATWDNNLAWRTYEYLLFLSTFSNAELIFTGCSPQLLIAANGSRLLATVKITRRLQLGLYRGGHTNS